MPVRGWLALALCAASLLAACGGDSKQSTQDVPKPALTVPEQANGPSSDTTTDTTATTDTTTTDTTTAPTAPLDQPNPANGGVPAPDSNQPQDTPSNDTPPKPDSPASRFEQFCAQNPGAC